MTPERAALARHRMVRARECLGDGAALLARGSLNGAVNRLYYAAFHAARAMLATHGLDASKHSGVIALFQRHFVKTGVVGADSARALPRAFELRQDCDYVDFLTLAGDEVASTRDAVAAFVEECERALARLLPPEAPEGDPSRSDRNGGGPSIPT